jgi:hypothetical protein
VACLAVLLRERTPACTPPPTSFAETDLVGTWVGRRLDDTDTLILREDGTYRQLIHIEVPEQPSFDYESDWQPWRLEYLEGGPPYLHLEGMRLCVSTLSLDLDCSQPGGGERDWNAYNENFYYDFCRRDSMLMVNEGILLVMGVPQRFEQPLRGIELAVLMNCTDCGPFTYELLLP